MNTPLAFPTIDMPGRRFLAHFEPRQRGHIANLFLDPVRRGMTDPNRVVSAVRHDLLVGAIRWGNHDGKERNEHIVTVIDAYPDEAFDYARWAVDWEKLSAKEKQRVKLEKWWATQPATEKQVKYLRALGYHGKIESKLYAIELIDRLLKGNKDFA